MRFVLVTGMPRTGTTGVGSALSHAAGAAYLYEPLNPHSGLRSVHDYFLLPGPDGPSPELRRQLAQVFAVDLRIRRGVWSTDPRWRRAVKTVTGSRSRASAVRVRLDPRVRTVVWKDPFAPFLVPLLRREHGLPCVVTVRPPLAVASSFKRLGWGFDLDRVHAALQLLTPGADYLAYDDTWALHRDDPTLNAAWLWRLVYGFLDTVLPAPGEPDTGPPLAWASSQVVLEAPVATYRSLYDTLGLAWTPRVRRRIEETYRDEGSSELSTTRAHDSRRNVQQANTYWARDLTEVEQARVSGVTAPVARALDRRVGPVA